MTSTVLLLEPFYTGSHKVLMDLLKVMLEDVEVTEGNDPVKVHLEVMSGKKWHWRARTSALYLAQTIPRGWDYRTVFASCVLPLHELIALRSDLQGGVKKVVYFHENQLVYPRRKTQERDFQYGYNQIMSCLVADVVLFNSSFNKDTFLSSLKSFFKLQPDFRPKNLRELIEPKCEVLYFPIDFQKIRNAFNVSVFSKENDPIKIVWPHRWEFDKNPDMFFDVLLKLINDGFQNFQISILGEQFSTNPPVFDRAKDLLKNHLLHFGYIESKSEYYRVLQESDIVVSTAHHEFFGVAMLEAVFCGCFPLCPKSLSYPEIFQELPDSFYSSEEGLYMKLKSFISSPTYFRVNVKSAVKSLNFSRFDWLTLKSTYLTHIRNRK